MTEGGIGVGKARRKQLVSAIRHATESGASDLGAIRESVINSIAKNNIDEESPETIALSLNKYLDINLGLRHVPVVIECLHSVKPNKEQLVGGKSYDIDRYEPGTFEISKRVSELTGASLILAKQSRVKSDMNRAARIRSSMSSTSEHSRSGRAALYWGLKSILRYQNRLGMDNKLKTNFYRLSVHGMKDNDEYGFAIAGSNNPADQLILQEFRDKLETSLKEIGLVDKVIIATKDDPKTAAYSGLPNISHFRKEPIRKELYQHPDFGEKFQTIQLEIARKYRDNPETRDLVSLALANSLKRYGADN